MSENSLVYLVRQRSNVEPVKIENPTFTGDTVIDDSLLKVLRPSLSAKAKPEKSAKPPKKKKVLPRNRDLVRRLDVQFLHLARLVEDFDPSKVRDIDAIVKPVVAVHKHLVPKDRAKRGYSILYCAATYPLIKTYYGVEPYQRILTDLDCMDIGSRTSIRVLQHSFVYYKGRIHLQGNFELTPEGYGKMMGFVRELANIRTKGNGDLVAQVNKRDAFITYNLMVKKKKSIALVQTPLSKAHLAGNDLAINRKSGMGFADNTLTLPTTNQSVNDYLYNALLKTYRDMKDVLF